MKKVLLLVLVLCVAPYAFTMEEKGLEVACKALCDENSPEYLLNEFIAAIRQGDYDRMVKLHKAGAPIQGAEGIARTPLMFAASHGSDEHLKIAEYLLDNGAEIDVSKEDIQNGIKPAIYDACSYGHTKVVELLLKRGAKVSREETGKDLLAVAYHLDEYDSRLINLLIQAGCTLTHLDPKWLIEASRAGDVESVKFLIFSGARLDIEDDSLGFTAFQHAANFGHAKVCKLLLKAGADSFKHRKIKDGKTSLELFAQGTKERIHDLIKEFEEAVPLEDRDNFKDVPGCCKPIISLQKVIDFSDEVLKARRQLTEANVKLKVLVPKAELSIQAVSKQLAQGVLKELLEDGILKKEECEDLDDSTYEEVLKWVHAFQMKRISSLVSDLEGKETDEHQDRETFFKYCKGIVNAKKFMDLLNKYQDNPLPLKYQCVNRIRKLVKREKLSKEDLPMLDEFGFKYLVTPKASFKKDDNNNNNEDEK